MSCSVIKLTFAVKYPSNPIKTIGPCKDKSSGPGLVSYKHAELARG